MLHVGDAGGSDIKYCDQMRRLIFFADPGPPSGGRFPDLRDDCSGVGSGGVGCVCAWKMGGAG